ncbi:hypothetical protein J5N97_017266 [Dioscorea zingiberensis]|uniref:AAA+ ATPase domain-containing protein n=1 Tax=Dioscorea zingiberensis TaxID=325984 RepID=A0A9D5HFZ3_9LILI|nr:hypothetical protein J5N97_017266 [Dioscorea zingiberensis]
MRKRAHDSSSNFSSILIARIRASDLETLDADAVVNHLRSHFPDYARLKLQPFSHRVHQAIQSLRRQPPRSPSSDAAMSSGRRRRLKEPSASPSPSASSSSNDEEELRPELDLTKSMLRDSYVKQASGVKRKPQLKEDDNVEIETPAVSKEVLLELNERERGSALEMPAVEKISGGGDLARKDEGPRFRDLGGMKGVLEELMMEVIVPLCHPQLPRLLGVRPMAGILLHGPPGCGKTKLAHAIANETNVPFYKISATEVVSGVSGASEENIRDLFKKAYRTAPSIVFIDEIDAIASKRENLQREMERRIVTQLMTCMDESHQPYESLDADSDSETSQKKPGYVLVIGATNRPDAVDQALRRPGRFDREIVLGVPDENARVEILIVLTRKLKLEGKFNLFKIARSTPGFVGADLAALVNKAGNLAMKRIIDRRRSEFSYETKEQMIEDWWRQPWAPEEMERLSITMADFEEAAKMVQPSSRREGFSSIPNVKWDDVGGLHSLRNEFDRYIVQRIKNPEAYADFGVNLEAGFLLYGPPGCGKTLIAKAVANEAGSNFIHIKGPELLNKYVGESELAVRTLFSRARACSPCILFFDEVDALTTKRGKEGGWVVERLLNQLLIELDGADQRQGVFVIGATNRLEVMDPAVLRPGRFGKVLYVPLPSADDRGLILKALARKKPIAPDVDLDAISHREACDNLTGADLAALMNEAAMAALEEKLSVDLGTSNIEPCLIKESHFEYALKKISPSVSEQQRSYYERFSQNLNRLMNAMQGCRHNAKQSCRLAEYHCEKVESVERNMNGNYVGKLSDF